MVLTVHDDAVGERALVAGPGIDITGATVSANVAGAFTMPQTLIASLGNRTFRYMVPAGNGGNINLVGLTGNELNTTTVTPTNTTLLTNSPRNNSTTSLANTLTGIQTTDPAFARGNVAGVGGFFMCWRFAIPVIAADSIVCVGCQNTALAGGANPSAGTNNIVFGCDTADTNVTLISTDNVGGNTKSAAIITKAQLATGDPNGNGPRVFEARIYALPNDTKVTCQLVDCSNANAFLFNADVTATLPLATTNLRPRAFVSSKTAVRVDLDFIHFYGFW